MSENTLPVSSSYDEQQMTNILFEIDNVSLSESPSGGNICDNNSLKIGSTNKDSFPDIVEKALAGIISDEDPFAQADFDVISYVNQLFPTEQSLGSIDDVMTRLKSEVQDVDSEIADIVQCQSAASLDGQKAVFDAKAAIQDLFSQVREIKAKTEMSESMVKEITRDIKQLDLAKKNLTSSITTLNHLHMLLSGVEFLQSYARTKDYNQIANLLPGISTVLEHFDKYLTIEKIKDLSSQVRDVRRQLTDQIVVDFKDYFSNPFAAGQLSNKKYTGSNMVDVCHVISVLDAPIKNELIAWFLQQQLAEYFVLFDDTQDSAWLDKLDERYKWFCSKLVGFEENYQNIFPHDWTMAKRLATEFCRQTHSMLDKLTQKRRRELDVKLLIFAIQRTVNFESLLCKRFPDVGIETATSTKGESVLKRNFFQHIIGSVFEGHMSVYIAAQDRNLSSLIEQFCAKIREDGALSNKNTLGVDLTAVTFPSSGDLFMVYKKCIQQTTQLTSDIAVIVELAQVLKKYLREYCYKCLVGSLPKTGSASGSQFTSTSTLIQSLLKEGEAVKLTRDEIYIICCVLTTAEFCAETTQQLQDKLKEKVQNAALHQKLDMNAEQDIFHSAISNCIQMLVHDLECACEPALQAMTKMQWSNVDHVGDESRYVSTIKTHFKTMIPRLRDHLANARKYFVQICLKFASSFVGKFLVYLFRCRSVNVDGAEQLLLDAHSLKTELLNLPNIESSVPRKPPVSYANVVSKGMNKAEMILKLIMTESTDHRYFVEQYLKLLPESDQSELQKILDMKGVRGTAAQSPFFEHYRNNGDQSKLSAISIASTVITATTTKPVISVSSINNLSAMMTSSSSVVNAYLSNVDAESTIKKLEKLVRKRVL